MKRRWLGKSGFSLVEVMLVSVMVGGMALALAAVIRTGLRTWQARENQMTASLELRKSIHFIAKELAQTQTGQLSVAGGGAMQTSTGPTNNSYTSIQFRVPEDVNGTGSVLDATGAVQWSPNPITYSLNGQDLQRTQGSAVSTLAHGVTAVSFRRPAATPSMLEVSVTVERGAEVFQTPGSGEAQPVALSTQIRLRN